MYKRVLTLLTCLLVISTGSLMAQISLGPTITKIRQGQYADAKSELSGFLKSDAKAKNIDQVYYWLGVISYNQDDFAGAQSAFQNGLSASKKSPYNLAGMGMIKLKEGANAEANELLEKADGINKDKDIQANFEIAKAYLTGGSSEIQQAKVILYQARDAEPDNPETYILLGEYYKKQGVPELAIEEFEKAKTKAPEYVPSYVALAELYYEQKDYQKGYENVKEALKLDENYAPAYRIRGELFLLSSAPDKFERAKNDLEKYVSLTKNDLKARIRYASFLFLTEDYQAALDEINDIKKDTITRVMYRLEGIAYNKMGDQDKAESAMNTYFKESKEKFTIGLDYVTMGDILRAKGDLKGADEYYDKAITKNPDKYLSKDNNIYADLADEYNKEIKGFEKEGRALIKERRGLLKEARQMVTAYNAKVKQSSGMENTPEKAALVDEAKALLAQAEAKQADAEATTAKRGELTKKIKGVAPMEVYYRKRVIAKKTEVQEGVGLADHYKLGLAQYKAEEFADCDKSFLECHKLKEDYLSPYQYRLRAAQQLENADTSSTEWFLKPVAEDIIRVFGDGDASSMDKRTKETVLSAYQVMAFYNFNPTTEAGDYHCDEAKPFIEKISSIDPAYTGTKPISDYCESAGGR
ncbi:MAG: tetratricopeptide repeat protein [Bacteroidota bacterium]